ncbi:type IV secretory system conjugative DNA transfer family protein [Rahnella sp. BCC 1045]|uniref:type IV secretory system conjugative DNA transfer family protein n=1 Tax=Rahnella sp. BCC 1045 TaxID=2816251 RepID=UPI001C275977|nr:type IV secretory system conjugative DNA transfer family protein [Rahnella sp. BCC 1045]MBU9819673.1 type IV secretory system conjugative DNA transfer family protein [Rahnella sp. BCC 1045]
MRCRLSVLLLPVLLTGCAGLSLTRPSVPTGPDGAPPPGPDAYLSPVKRSTSEVSDNRREMLTDAARTLGFRGGKAQRAWELKRNLEARAVQLDATYDFRPLISARGWLPPVITEAVDVAHVTPDQIRTASRVYEIVEPERFVSNPPSWRNWLMAGLSTASPDGPEGSLVPDNGVQRDIWQAALNAGWAEGRQSADDTLEANVNRLTRDYNGMLQYMLLRRENIITAPVVTEQQQTVTGDSHKLTTGDRDRRLEAHAGFVTDKARWKPIINTEKR